MEAAHVRADRVLSQDLRSTLRLGGVSISMDVEMGEYDQKRSTVNGGKDEEAITREPLNVTHPLGTYQRTLANNPLAWEVTARIREADLFSRIGGLRIREWPLRREFLSKK